MPHICGPAQARHTLYRYPITGLQPGRAYEVRVSWPASVSRRHVMSHWQVRGASRARMLRRTTPHRMLCILQIPSVILLDLEVADGAVAHRRRVR